MGKTLEKLHKAVEDAEDACANEANRWLTKWGCNIEWSDAEQSAWMHDTDNSIDNKMMEADLDASHEELEILSDVVLKAKKDLANYKGEQDNA